MDRGRSPAAAATLGGRPARTRRPQALARDQLGLEGVVAGQPFQGFLDQQQRLGVRAGRHVQIFQGDAFLVTTPFEGTLATGAVDQNAPHRFRRSLEEVVPTIDLWYFRLCSPGP